MVESWGTGRPDYTGQQTVVDEVTKVNVTAVAYISGQPIYMTSGHLTVVSGVVDAIVSGTVVTSVSGQALHLGASDTVRTADLIRITGASGGEPIARVGWCSGNLHSILVKSMSGNEDIYIGGIDCRPYSGHGFALSMAEAVTVDMDSPMNVYAYAAISGQFLTWMGTDY